MGSNQKPGGRASALVTSQRLLLVVVALVLAAYAASTWYTRHMWDRVNDAIDTFAAENVYGLASISATRETLLKVDSLLHREVQHSGDLDLKTQVDELRSELGTEGDRLVGEHPEREGLGKAAADLRAVQEIMDRVEAAVTTGDRVETQRLIEILDRSVYSIEGLLDAAQEMARREDADFDEQLARLRRRAMQIQHIFFNVADGLLTLLVGLFAVRALRAGARAEGAVRTSEERFRALVEASAQVVRTAAADGGIVEDSPSWLAFTGQSHERARGFGWLDAVHPEDRERVAALWKKAVATTTRFDAEFRILHVSGEWRWIAARSTPLLDPSGAAREWIGMISDIDERRRIASQQRFLAELEPLLDSTLDYRERLTILARMLALRVGDCCSVWISGNGERPPVCKVFHSAADPAMERVCERLEQLWLQGGQAAPWRGREPPQVMVLSHVSAQSMASAGVSEEYLRLLGELGAESMMILPLAVHGQLLGALFVASSNPHHRFGADDLVFSQEIAAQATLSIENAQLYDTARQAIQARDDVLRIVAHDLRNPIAVIQLAAQLLSRQPSEPGEGSPSAVQRILRSSARATRLIDDLLEVTRMEVGKLVLEHHSIPAAEIVHGVVEAQRAIVSAASLELQIDVVEHLPAVWVDRDRLEQVFANLIANSVRFTPAGGRITIGAAPTEGGAVQFWVTDTGAGFDAESREHLFDRFWQARKGARHGVGLGLSIVKSIVEAHGGSVSVEGGPGLGSTFYFTIPAAAAQQHRPGTVQAH
jgi:PAS domain S-box-containing protein